MKLGFLTGALGDMSLSDKITWASQAGFSHLELSVWPRDNTRDYSGSDLDVNDLSDETINQVKKEFSDAGLTISALAYYDNMLHEDEATRRGFQEHLKKVILLAERLGVPFVGTFVGRNASLSIVDNFDLYEKEFTPLVEFAKEHGVKLMIENCPMPVWERDGFAGTISYSPEMWREMFRRIPSDHFGLNFDPSHLFWLQIDHLKALEEFKDKIFHVHAKDTKFDHSKLYDYGIYGKQLEKNDPFDLGWITAKMPGLGDIDWTAFYQKLKEIGYHDVVSIEHEDHDYSGSEEAVKQGLEIARDHLKKSYQEVFHE